ncbi:MAG: CARDB domain-containing protein [Thermoplasmata archaeon]
MRALLVLLLLVLALIPLPSQAQGPVAIFISTPDVAGTGKDVPVSVTVAGGPGEDNGTFSIKVYLRGEDMEGAAPLEESPLEKSSSDKTFDFNVTMPLAEQQVEIVVEANSTKGGQWSVSSSSKTVTVLVPLIVSASVVNTGDVEIKDVPVFLYLDGKQVAETRLGSLKPEEFEEVSFEYLPVGLSVGTHRLEIRVDLNEDGNIDPAMGEVVLQMTFVKEAEPINPLYIVLAVIGAFVAALFVGAAIRQRRATKK